VVCKSAVSGFDSRLALRGTARLSPSLSHTLDAERRGGRLLNGTRRVRLPPRVLSVFRYASGRGSAWKSACLGDRRSPVRIRPPRPSPTHVRSSSSPSARWPRQLDPQSRNAGSTPAGDTGPTRWPALLPRGARPGGRAHQRFPAGALSPRRPSPCPGGPGTVLRTRSTRFDSSQGGRRFFSDARRQHTPWFRRHQTQASEACRPGFDSRPGLRREGRPQARLITSLP
jgi:hypothetical protein